MEYIVQKLAKLSGVSPRTLRYYDQINLLKPSRINSSGYRIYGRNEVNRLQNILFYKELGVNLENIKEIINSESFDYISVLKDHKEKLIIKRNVLEELIINIDKTIKQSEGEMKMSDKEKFEGFKQKIINENEGKFGNEIRQKYGNDVIDKSNKKIMNMDQKEYENITGLENEVIETLKEAFQTGDINGELAQKSAQLHREWLCKYWSEYSKEAHAALANMYVDDERFTAYYDKHTPGMAKFLRDVILIYTGFENK